MRDASIAVAGVGDPDRGLFELPGFTVPTSPLRVLSLSRANQEMTAQGAGVTAEKSTQWVALE